MSPLRLNGSTSGYSQIDAPAVAGDQLFTLPGTGGTLDRLNRAGNILQVVNATYSTQASSSSLSYADTGLTASITPTSSTSKIIVFAVQNGVAKSSGNADNGVNLKLFRGSTELAYNNGATYTATAISNNAGTVAFCILDSPSTTSSVTYKTQFANTVAAASAMVQVNFSVSSITLLEVAA